MNFELAEQSIQYTFGNKRYTNGLKSRMIKNVKKGAAAEDLKKSKSSNCRLTRRQS